MEDSIKKAGTNESEGWGNKTCSLAEETYWIGATLKVEANLN